MTIKIKPRKCRLKKCGAAFRPKTEWQKYCSTACRNAAAYRKTALLARRGRKAIEAEAAAGRS